MEEKKSPPGLKRQQTQKQENTDFFDDLDVKEEKGPARNVASPGGPSRRKTMVASKGANPSPDGLMVIGQSFPPTNK